MSKRKTALFKQVCVYCRSCVPGRVKHLWMGPHGSTTSTWHTDHVFEWDGFDEERWLEECVQCPESIVPEDKDRGATSTFSVWSIPCHCGFAVEHLLRIDPNAVRKQRARNMQRDM